MLNFSEPQFPHLQIGSTLAGLAGLAWATGLESLDHFQVPGTSDQREDNTQPLAAAAVQLLNDAGETGDGKAQIQALSVQHGCERGVLGFGEAVGFKKTTSPDAVVV